MSESSSAFSGSGVVSGFAFRGRRRPAVGVSASAVAVASNGCVTGVPSERVPTSSPLLGLFERRVARLEQRDAALEASQRFFEPDAAVFEVGDDPLQFGERGLKRWLFCVRRCGHRKTQWDSVDSTRLVSWPAATIVVIRSPIASWPDAVTSSPVSARRVIE